MRSLHRPSTWVEAARRRRHRADKQLVAADRKDQHPRQPEPDSAQQGHHGAPPGTPRQRGQGGGADRRPLASTRTQADGQLATTTAQFPGELRRRGASGGRQGSNQDITAELVPRGQVIGQDMSQAPGDAMPHHRVSHLSTHCKPEAGRLAAAGEACRDNEPSAHAVPRRWRRYPRCAAAAGPRVAPVQTEMEARPLRRRAERIDRPARVRIRRRKPCFVPTAVVRLECALRHCSTRCWLVRLAARRGAAAHRRVTDADGRRGHSNHRSLRHHQRRATSPRSGESAGAWRPDESSLTRRA